MMPAGRAFPIVLVDDQAVELLANLARAEAFMLCTSREMLESVGKKAARFDLSPLHSLTETIREQVDGLSGTEMDSRLVELLTETLKAHTDAVRRFDSLLVEGREHGAWNLK